MPFDDKTFVPDLKTFVPGREGLRQLSYLLRHPELWPVNHSWDFDMTLVKHDCGTTGCAMGIAGMVWPDLFVGADGFFLSDWVDRVVRLFHVTHDEAHAIFTDDGIYGKPMEDVTPTDVADAIDEYLANH